MSSNPWTYRGDGKGRTGHGVAFDLRLEGRVPGIGGHIGIVFDKERDAAQVVRTAFDEVDAGLGRRSGRPGNPQHLRFRVDAGDASRIGMEVECEKARPGAEIEHILPTIQPDQRGDAAGQQRGVGWPAA